MALVKSHTYKESGVDIDAGEAFVDRIKPFIQKTRRPEVLSSIGGYAGLFSLPKNNYSDPVLVSTTDGVGTKLKLALQYKKYRGLGQDLVAMSVNDLLCVGAEPLFFLDYYASGKLDLEIATGIIEGMSESLTKINCTLLGGETAEMPGLYQKEDFDLAGFAVGIVNRNEIIDGSQVSVGNSIIALASSGLHSNGFSLVRKIIEDQSLSLDKIYPPLATPLGDLLLEPTRIYVNSILTLKREFKILALAHITGGGLIENPPRVFPKTCRALFRKNSWNLSPLFQQIQKWGKVAEEEMLRVFNCGVGLILIVEKSNSHEMVNRLNSLGEKAWIVGEIVKREKTEPSVSFE